MVVEPKDLALLRAACADGYGAGLWAPLSRSAQPPAITTSRSRTCGQSCSVAGSKSAPFGHVSVPTSLSSDTALNTFGF
jgi:hypothetical protein